MDMTGRKAAQRTDAMTDSDPDSGTDNMPFLRDPKRLIACGICGTCDICKAGGLLALGMIAWSQNLDARCRPFPNPGATPWTATE
jgi:hypothetical protein